MRLMMKEKQAVTKVIAQRYQKVSKKQKGTILNEFVSLTGYDRCYAGYLLRVHGSKVRVSSNKVLIIDVKKKTALQRPREYDEKVFSALRKTWYIMDCICGKRLGAILKEVIPILERHKEIVIGEQTREKLYRISPATIDRLLSAEKKKYQLRGKSHTKPGTLLKSQIPIRTFSQWDEKRPGFTEIDLVGHEGGNSQGEFIQTLDVTDVCTGWTDTQAVRNKAEKWVFEALKDIRGRLPFELLGIDSDNGSEFINNHLLMYCKEQRITFTRARSYRKNDNCFVEQKNYSVVRRAVGYLRYDTNNELDVLNDLYGYLRLYTNFFQPVMKLIKKTRTGSKITKKYDKPTTPYQRVLLSLHVPQENKNRLQNQYALLNPAELKRNIKRLQEKLQELTFLKEVIKNQNLDKTKNLAKSKSLTKSKSLGTNTTAYV